MIQPSHLEVPGPTPCWSTKTLPATQLRRKGREKQKHKLENKTNKMNRQNHRRNFKSKLIKRESHKEAYTYTLTKREKGKKYIYMLKKGREQPNQ